MLHNNWPQRSWKQCLDCNEGCVQQRSLFHRGNDIIELLGEAVYEYSAPTDVSDEKQRTANQSSSLCVWSEASLSCFCELAGTSHHHYAVYLKAACESQSQQDSWRVSRASRGLHLNQSRLQQVPLSHHEFVFFCFVTVFKASED